jgi:hypothetical protein
VVNDTGAVQTLHASASWAAGADGTLHAFLYDASASATGGLCLAGEVQEREIVLPEGCCQQGRPEQEQGRRDEHGPEEEPCG